MSNSSTLSMPNDRYDPIAPSMKLLSSSSALYSNPVHRPDPKASSYAKASALVFPRCHGIIAVASGALAVLLLIPATTQAQYRITGIILSATEGTPIPHARLTAEPDHPCPKPAPADTTADDQGHFVLTLACPNTWRLTAEAPNFASQSYEQHGPYSTGIVLTTTQPAYDIAFRMTPNSIITGFITDEAGEPIREAKVSLLRAEPGPDPPHPIANTTTDDLGSYEFPNLLPGDYQIAVQAQPWYAAAGRGGIRVNSLPNAPPAGQNATDPSLDLTYPITWFPGVITREGASFIPLAGGATQQADLRLTPIPSIHVLIPPNAAPGSGSEQGGDGRRPITIPQMERLSELGPSDFRPTSVTIAPDGSLDLGGFAPGSYGLSRFRSRGEQQTFNLAPDSPRTVEPTITTAPAEDSDNPGANHRRDFHDRHGDADRDQPRTQTVGLTLSGIATLAGKPASGTLLLLIPATTARTPQSVPRQQSNTDGSFTFARLTPGRYILIAMQNGWNLDLRNPATLASYLIHGQPISLITAITLHQPIPVQTP